MRTTRHVVQHVPQLESQRVIPVATYVSLQLLNVLAGRGQPRHTVRQLHATRIAKETVNVRQTLL